MAVPLPARLRHALQAAVTEWRMRPGTPDLRWTDPSAWHVTLAFLGATDPGSVPALVAALEDVTRTGAPFRVPTGGVGAFPRPGAAQTVWYRIDDPDQTLAELARRVQAATLAGGGGNRFRPHLTVARSRVRRGEPLDRWLATLEAPTGMLPVRGVTLYRSHLGLGPARYEVLASRPLGGARSPHA